MIDNLVPTIIKKGDVSLFVYIWLYCKYQFDN